jgi:subtilisin family serine protease
MNKQLAGSAHRRIVRVKPLVAALSVALCVGMAMAAHAEFESASSTNGPSVHNVKEKAQALPTETVGSALYTIVLKGEPLASYEGTVAGYAKASRVQAGKKAGRLDVHSASAKAYVNYLSNRQTNLTLQLSQQLGRTLEPVQMLQHALNAVIVELDEYEAEIVRQRSDIEFVEREQVLELLTDRGPSFIGAPTIWDGTSTGGLPSMGEGMVVAILDTGINWQSPAFAATGPLDGYMHVNPLGAGTYIGQCGPTPPNADLGRCNEKLIGMFDFTSTSTTRSANDLGGHGSHTASTVAGNTWDAPFGGGVFRISGVAPHANVIAYRVCTTGCSSSASTQSINSAIATGVVDALNYSISGGTAPWTDTVSVAFRNAVNAGIFVAASAGNDGPTAGSVNHVEPWVETVAASTKNNVVGFQFNLTGPGTPPADTQNLPLRPAAPPLPTASIIDAPIVQSPNFANGSTDGCSAYPAGTFTGLPGAPADRIFADGFEEVARVGAIAVLNLDQSASSCGSGARRTAALNAGAIGVIFVDPAFINLGAADTSWSMLRADWDKAWTQIQTNPAQATASLLLPTRSFDQRGDVVAGFSSRGPRATSNQFVIKPDITAPGVDILAAYTAETGGATSTAMENGTSMSGPHIAGAATLVRAVRPAWTPTQVRSAINLTAKNDGLIRADNLAINPWDLGSGRVDLTQATRSGLLLDETNANFLASNPASGGTLSTLNLASMALGACATTCTFTRTVSNALATATTYDLSITGLPTGAASVSPATFTIAPGATQAITVTVTGTLLTTGAWNFGKLRLDATDSTLPRLQMPIGVRP